MLLNVNNYSSIVDFIKTIKYDILRILLFSVGVGFIAYGKMLSHFHIPLALVAIVGTALSLLVTFRTGQAYDRWWEARMVWGAIVNDSRTFVRQIKMYLPESEHAHLLSLVDRQVIWCYTLSEGLRKQNHSEEVVRYMGAHNISSSNLPNTLLDLHSQELKSLYERGQINAYHLGQLDDTLSRLCDSMGKCERIKNTVFPASYGTLIHMLIYFFAFLLPFGLDDNFIVIKIILTAIIPIIFFIIEKTAILMQDPFENAPMDTPMTTISNTIAKNLYEMVGIQKENGKGRSESFYYIL